MGIDNPADRQCQTAVPTNGGIDPPYEILPIGRRPADKGSPFGVAIVGGCEQTGVYPRDNSQRPPNDIDEIWGLNSERFRLSARASGALNAQSLWGEAMAQVPKAGWRHLAQQAI